MLVSGIVRRHGLWAIVALTFSALLSLLFKPLSPAVRILGLEKPDIGARHPVSNGSAPVNKIITSHFGSPTVALNLSSPRASQKLFKRAVNPQDFHGYVCKGEKHLAAIEAAFNGAFSAGLEFSDADLTDGWTKDDTDKMPLSRSWLEPLQDTQGRKPTTPDSKYIKYRQDKAFPNAAGDLVSEFMKEAIYYVYYLPNFYTIVASNIVSPKYEVEKKFAGQKLSHEDIAKRVPKLNRFSDVIWTVWKQQRPSDPRKLRYLAHDFITNPTTVDIMSYIFGAKYRGDKEVPWPGMEFGLDSEEGKALLASPNGIGTYRLLTDRAATLGRRSIKVTIFTGKHQGRQSAMARSTASWRGLQGCSILIASALLLLLTVYHGFVGFGTQVSPNRAVSREADTIDLPASQYPANLPRSIASPVGRLDHTVNFSSPVEHHTLCARADPPRNYADLICKGEKFLNAIKAAFEGSTPTISFPESELDNGWTKTSEVDDDDLEAIQRRWKGTFEALFGAYPPETDIKPVILVQDKEYDTIIDDHIDKPTNAESQGLYHPKQQLAMSAVSYSAAQRILDRNKKKPLSKAERDALLPTISRLSDLIWLAWTTVSSKPEKLRYLARDNIDNENTQAVMKYLFLRDKGQANSVVWPGLSYDGNSDEGKALLATPNGRATAWLLIDHGQRMEWRLKSRQLKVYIFSYAGKYCMLWDLEPQSPQGQSKRDDHSQNHQPKHSVERHVKRDGKADFDAAKKQGDIAYVEMQAAFDGCAKEVQDFEPSAFENGWTRKADRQALPGKIWQDVLEKFSGKAPTADTSRFVNVVHDQDFTNSQGQLVKFIKADAGFALYEQHYLPTSSAIIVSQTRSPAYTVRKRLGPAAGSSANINDNLVPPLNRWSDATWTLWKEKGGGNDLRYIGRDYIFNAQTESVMNYIFEQRGKNGDERKFPGLEFGMDSEEGRALLGTPNGVGAARLLIDRAEELGRREVRIFMFEPEEEYLCMLVDMVPVVVQARGLDALGGNLTELMGVAEQWKKSRRYQKGPRAVRGRVNEWL
ncbi:MAG: hypothetical protein Q9169_005340 [Polycauliona sp. 2 TL-2023]